MPAKYDGVLFDFDGVVVDSEPIHFKSWLDVLHPLKIEFDWEWFEAHCIGIADSELFDTIAEMGSRVSGAQVREVYPEKTRLYHEAMLTSPPFAPGIGSLLCQLADSGVSKGLVTSSLRAEVEPILLVGGLHFKPCIFADDVAYRKPHPEPYLRAAALMGVSRILAVEDSAHGAQSARAAGLDVLRIGSVGELVPRLNAALGW